MTNHHFPSHTQEAALRAAELGVDYLQVGTMFPTGSHPEKGDTVEGPKLMAQVDAALRAAGRREALALVGVGGINEANCARVVAAGADGVAVISGLAAEGLEARATVRALEAAMSLRDRDARE
jgi:thiamine-phosphate pyrophosphorylase